MQWALLAILLAIPSLLCAHDRIGYIEVFGYGGMDVKSVRHALPFREGDPFNPEIVDEAPSAVRRITGRAATDVYPVCCTNDGDMAIFIGLPGTSTRQFIFEPTPKGVVTLPAELIRLYEAMVRVEMEAAKKSLTEEDRALGYRLLKEPAARDAELPLRTYTLSHEEEILNVLSSSGDARQRAIAVDTLGFGARTPRQIAALVRSTRDPADEVRNNATRALAEILQGDPKAASVIPPSSFIAMLRSGTWTDRNKGAGALMSLTQSRDPRCSAAFNPRQKTRSSKWRAGRWGGEFRLA